MLNINTPLNVKDKMDLINCFGTDVAYLIASLNGERNSLFLSLRNILKFSVQRTASIGETTDNTRTGFS